MPLAHHFDFGARPPDAHMNARRSYASTAGSAPHLLCGWLYCRYLHSPHRAVPFRLQRPFSLLYVYYVLLRTTPPHLPTTDRAPAKRHTTYCRRRRRGHAARQAGPSAPAHPHPTPRTTYHHHPPNTPGGQDLFTQPTPCLALTLPTTSLACQLLHMPHTCLPAPPVGCSSAQPVTHTTPHLLCAPTHTLYTSFHTHTLCCAAPPLLPATWSVPAHTLVQAGHSCPLTAPRAGGPVLLLTPLLLSALGADTVPFPRRTRLPSHTHLPAAADASVVFLAFDALAGGYTRGAHSGYGTTLRPFPSAPTCRANISPSACAYISDTRVHLLRAFARTTPFLVQFTPRWTGTYSSGPHTPHRTGRCASYSNAWASHLVLPILFLPWDDDTFPPRCLAQLALAHSFLHGAVLHFLSCCAGNPSLLSSPHHRHFGSYWCVYMPDAPSISTVERRSRTICWL